ncbi:MAG: hypothetical protein K9I94_07965 [Bacteroidales bacterium]|nr:hypothetical protein [Bacteroidales bacterium]
MKKRTLHPVMLLAVIFVLPALLTSCGGSKKAAKAPDEELIEQYCTGPDYFTTDDYFRDNAVGESVDQSIAKRKALSNARANLAGQIEVVVSGTIDNYFESHEVNNVEDARERYEGLTREAFRQKLNGTRTICDKLTRTSEGKYKSYIAIELAGDEIINAMNQRLSNDEKTRIDYDYEKFKKTYEEEMEKMRDQKGY